MSRPASLVALAAAVVALGLAPQALAGGCGGGGKWKPAPTYPVHPAPAPTVVKPIGWTPQPTVVPSRNWYFGMSLQITNTPYGRGLQVASITPGGPAQRAGLEQGDTLLTANGMSLQNAYNNEHGVQLLQSAVGAGSAPAPTAAVTTALAVAPSSSVQLAVLNVRTGGVVYLNVFPQPVGGPAPIPTAPAPTATTF